MLISNKKPRSNSRQMDISGCARCPR